MQSILMTHHDHARLTSLVEQLDGRIDVDPSNLEALEEELARARVVNEAELPPDVVTLDSELVLVDIDTNEELHMRVVFPSAADIACGCISVLAPVGLAVLGSREGEELQWPTPSRVRRFRIQRVIYQPEADGRWI